jgi:hypothetical protein
MKYLALWLLAGISRLFLWWAGQNCVLLWDESYINFEYKELCDWFALYLVVRLTMEAYAKIRSPDLEPNQNSVSNPSFPYNH